MKKPFYSRSWGQKIFWIKKKKSCSDQTRLDQRPVYTDIVSGNKIKKIKKTEKEQCAYE